MKQAIVAGGGIFGVSASIALVLRGWGVDLFDAGPLPRPEAASTELMERALPLWRASNLRWREELYHQDGFLVLSRAPLRPGGFEHASRFPARAVARDPDRPGLAVASGDSGHGFKFAPVLGDVIADAIEDKPSRFTARFGWRMPAARKAENVRWGLS